MRTCSPSIAGPSGPSSLIKDQLAGGASRLAALLLPQIRPVFSVVAPCQPGAALRDLALVQRGRATKIAAALAAALLATAGPVARERAFTPDDIVSFKTIGNLAVSPDGRLAAFVVRGADLDEARPEGNLWLAGLTGSASPRQITFAKGTESAPEWSPDGRRLAFLARRPVPGSQGAGAAGAAQTSAPDASNVWVMRVDGGEARAYADTRASVAGFAWAPDGARMVVLAPAEETEDEARRRRQKDDGYLLGRQWRRHRAWIVAGDGQKPVPITDGVRHVVAAEWSPDGRHIAIITTPDPEADAAEDAKAEIIDVASGRARDVPGGSLASSLTWSADGSALAFTRAFDGRGISREDLYVWRIAGGAPAALTTAIDRDIEDVFWREPAAIVIRYALGAVDAVASLDPATGRVVDAWKPGFSVGELRPAGAGWAFVRGDRPPELWHAASAGAEPRVLTAVNAATADLALGRIEVVKWRGADGEIEGVLTAPPGFSASRRYPLIVNPHGGPRGHSQADFDPTASYFASLGFVVLRPNFRGSTGYGDAFTKGNVGDWGDGPFKDVMAGVDTLVARGVADPDRLFIYGWSYGGYLTNWAITHTDRFRAAASGAGVADLRMQYSISDARRWRFDYFKGSPFVGNDALYARESPITYIRQAKTPTLFVHGAEDVRCPLPQGLMMHRGLKDNGVETEIAIYPREGHGFVEPRHIIDRAKRVADWFRSHDAAGKPGTASNRE